MKTKLNQIKKMFISGISALSLMFCAVTFCHIGGGAVLGDGFPSSAEQQIYERENQLGLDIANEAFEPAYTELLEKREKADQLFETTTETWTHEGIKSILDEYGFGYIDDLIVDGQAVEDPADVNGFDISGSVTLDYEFYEGLPENQVRCYHIYDEAGWIFAMWATMYPTNTPQFTKIYLENDLDFGGYLYDVCDPVEAGMFHGFWGEIDGQGHTISNVMLNNNNWMFMAFGADADVNTGAFITFGQADEIYIPSKVSSITIQGYLATASDSANAFLALMVAATTFKNVTIDTIIREPAEPVEDNGSYIVYACLAEKIGVTWEDCTLKISSMDMNSAAIYMVGDVLVLTGEEPSEPITQWHDVNFNNCRFEINHRFETEENVEPYIAAAANMVIAVNLNFTDCVAVGNIYVKSATGEYAKAAGFVNGVYGFKEIGPAVKLTMTSCKNYVNIATSYMCAGFYSFMEHDTNAENEELIFKNCSNYGNMYGLSYQSDGWGVTFIAGICSGIKGNNVLCDGCNNYGNIYCATYSGGITAKDNEEGETIKITNCSNFGTFYYPCGNLSCVGGIAMEMAYDSGIDISNCNNYAKVIAKAPDEDYVYTDRSGTQYRHSMAVIYGGICVSSTRDANYVNIKNCKSISYTENINDVNGIYAWSCFSTNSYTRNLDVEIDGCVAQTYATFDGYKIIRNLTNMTGGMISMNPIITGIASCYGLWPSGKISLSITNCASDLYVNLQDCELFTADRDGGEGMSAISSFGMTVSDTKNGSAGTCIVENIQSSINVDCTAIPQEQTSDLKNWFNSLVGLVMPTEKTANGLTSLGESAISGLGVLEHISVNLTDEQYEALEGDASAHDVTHNLEIEKFITDSSIYYYNISSPSRENSKGYYNGSFSDDEWFWNDSELNSEGHYIKAGESFPLLRKFYAVGEGITYSSPDTTFESILHSKYTQWQAA